MKTAICTTMSFALLLCASCNTVTNQTDDGQGDQITINSLILDASETVARSVAAILPNKDLQAIFEGGMSFPLCPTMETQTGMNEIQLTLNYGTGCSPSQYQGSSFSGIVSGTSFITVNAYDFTFDGFSVDGESIEGTIGGGFSQLNTVTTFLVSVNLLMANGTSVIGNATVSHDSSTGILTIEDSSLTLNNSQLGTWSASYSNAVVDFDVNNNFLPKSGSVSADLISGGSISGANSLTVNFTSATPVDGSVTMSSLKISN